MLQTGDILASKYRVEQVLGKGGMGYVVAAMHMKLEQRVAIKLLMPELCGIDEAVARFLREARAAVRIQSEHVARVLDVGTHDDGVPFMVMEFLAGHDLARELELRETLPIEEAVDYVLQACEALAEAHTLGIVHRDLKPANLFKTHRTDGTPFIKVLDFGISKALIPDGDTPLISLTATQGVVGSPHYMSPEQARNPKAVDARSDIWSLGVILYELIGGAPPFVAVTPLSVLASVMSDPPASLRSLRPDLPDDLEAVITKCLEKNPSRRYDGISDLAQALKSFAPRSGASSAMIRISAIVRSARERVASITPTALTRGEDAPTLDSAGAAPRPHPRSSTPPSSTWDESKHTQTGWGHSQDTGRRSRRRLFGISAVVALLGGAVLVWRVSLPASRDGAPETAGSGASEPTIGAREKPAAALEKTALTVAPAAASVALPVAPSLVPVAPSPEDAGAAPESALPKGAPPAVRPGTVVRRPPGKVPAADPVSVAAPSAPPPPPVAPTPGVDPLDGRR